MFLIGVIVGVVGVLTLSAIVVIWNSESIGRKTNRFFADMNSRRRKKFSK